jgi:hypothetical protein
MSDLPKIKNIIIEAELGRSNFYVSGLKKAGAPMRDMNELRQWIKEHPGFSASKVWKRKTITER